MFLDNSKTFDIAWHYVLTFKLVENGSSGNLPYPKTEADSKQPTPVLERWNCMCSLTFIRWLGKNQLLKKQSIIHLKTLSLIRNILLLTLPHFLAPFSQSTKDISSSQNGLNEDPNKITDWTSQWRMSYNPNYLKQPQEVIVSLNVNKQHLPSIFDNSNVTQINCQKHLDLLKTYFQWIPREHIWKS